MFEKKLLYSSKVVGIVTIAIAFVLACLSEFSITYLGVSAVVSAIAEIFLSMSFGVNIESNKIAAWLSAIEICAALILIILDICFILR